MFSIFRGQNDTYRDWITPVSVKQPAAAR
jgi:hypothetical protein